MVRDGRSDQEHCQRGTDSIRLRIVDKELEIIYSFLTQEEAYNHNNFHLPAMTERFVHWLFVCNGKKHNEPSWR